MIHLKMPFHFTSEYKKERKKLFKYLETELPKAGSKLVPVPLEIFPDLEPNYRNIYKVSNMDKVPFGKKILELCPNTIFFAARMHGVRKKRIRKLAYMTLEDGRKYIVYQQSVDYSNVISILDLQNKTRTKTKSLDKLKFLFKIQKSPLKEIPLLINNKWAQEYPEFKKEIHKRLSNG